MLNPFPELLVYMLVAPVILRVLLGLIFINFGYSKIFSHRQEKIKFFEKLNWNPAILYVWIFGILEIIAGLSLLAGFYAQIGALIAGLILLGCILLKYKKPSLLQGETLLYVALLAIAISLLFLGAGFWAMDVGL